MGSEMCIRDRSALVPSDEVLPVTDELALGGAFASSVHETTTENDVSHTSPMPPTAAAKPISSSAFNSYSRGNFDTNVTITPSITLNSPKKNDRVIQTLPPMAAKVMTPVNQSSNTLNTSINLDGLPPEGLEEYLLNQEKQLIIAALNKSGGNKTQAAKLLNTTFRSLRYRMKKLEIDNDDD